MIFPIQARAFLDVSQIELGVGIKIFFGKSFKDLSLDGKTLDGQNNIILDRLEKFRFIL